MKKPLIWILATLALVLFPDLPEAVAAVVSVAVVWVSTQPILIGVAIGMAAWPHLRRAKTPATAGH